jgi:hypothetical protein
MSSQIDLALNKSPSGRPRYFKGREETVQPKMLAKPSTLLTLPMGTNSDLARLILSPEIALKHRNKQCKLQRWSRFAPQNIIVLSANKRWEMDINSIPMIFLLHFEDIEDL